MRRSGKPTDSKPLSCVHFLSFRGFHAAFPFGQAQR